MKPQRLLKPEIKNSCKCLTYIYNIIEHSQTFIQHRLHAGKTASVYIKMENACFYKVFLSTACNKVSALLSSSLYSQILSLLSMLALLTTKEIQYIFYMRGLFELFPPIYLPYSITLNGLSSPLSGSRSQPYKKLKAYLFYSLHKGTTLWLNNLDI
jgi:hypothetical protein